MRVLAATCVLLLSLVMPGCGKTPEERFYRQVDSDDAGMNQAIEKARATRGEFLAALRAHRPGTAEFAVKKPFRTPVGGEEHMWITVLEENDGRITGMVNNDAEETKLVKLGQTVHLDLSETSDWMYHDGRKLIGGYTIRYFVDRMTPKERAEFLKVAPFEL